MIPEKNPPNALKKFIKDSDIWELHKGRDNNGILFKLNLIPKRENPRKICAKIKEIIGKKQVPIKNTKVIIYIYDAKDNTATLSFFRQYLCQKP